MKRINAYYRKHKTIVGCPGLSWEVVERLKSSMSWDRASARAPYPAYMLTNNNTNMKRIKDRIAELEKKASTNHTGWTFPGGEVVFDKGDNRLRIL